jgi:hypothetical protein
MAAADLNPRALMRQAYDALWRGRGDLLRVAAAPVGITLLIDVILFSLAPAEADADATGSGLGGSFWSYLLLGLSIPPGVLLAVNWLRVLILGSGSVIGLGLRWGLRETRFLVRMIVIGLAGMVVTVVLLVPVMLLFGLLGGMGGFAAAAHWFGLFVTIATVVIYVYVSLRLSLALAAAAIDAPGTLPGTLAQSWIATRGIGQHLTLAAMAVAGPFYVLVFLLPALLVETGVEALAPLSSLLLQVVLSSLTSVAGFTLVALAHRRLSAPPAGQT